MEYKKTFGELLQHYLSKQRVTEASLARNLRVSPSTVYRWVNDETTPPSHRINQIAEFLKLNETELNGLLRSAGYEDTTKLRRIIKRADSSSQSEESRNLSDPDESTIAVVPISTSAELAFEPEAEDETLIVIAKFFVSQGNRDHLIHREIRDKIRAEAQKILGDGVRAEIEPTVLESSQKGEALALAARYNASIIIWGDDSGIRITVNFLNLRYPDFYAASVRISETRKTQVVNPPAYVQFIVVDLPAQLIFLSFFAIAQSCLSGENYVSAILCFLTAINSIEQPTELPGLAEAYFLLAATYNIFPKFKHRVIDIYDQAISLKPDFTDAYLNRGVSRYLRDNLDSAIADFEQVILLKPDFALAYINRGLALNDQNRLDRALEDFNHAIRLDSSIAVAYMGRGENLYLQNRLSEAIEDFDHGIQLEPNIAQYHFNRGIAHYAQESTSNAIEDFNQAIRLSPLWADPYRNLGIIYYRQGKLDEAVANFNQAIRLNPDFSEAYLYRGITLCLLGKKEAGIADIYLAKQKNPELFPSPTTDTPTSNSVLF